MYIEKCVYSTDLNQLIQHEMFSWLVQLSDWLNASLISTVLCYSGGNEYSQHITPISKWQVRTNPTSVHRSETILSVSKQLHNFRNKPDGTSSKFPNARIRLKSAQALKVHVFYFIPFA